MLSTCINLIERRKKRVQLLFKKKRKKKVAEIFAHVYALTINMKHKKAKLQLLFT